ncbi:hypothetical protein AB0B62_28560 [Micromonospora chalcea]|uniref:hypothetical protein n=1 Tax=Micromonospora chalcea TaxID=1874 RepID=UPI0033F79B0D
MSLADLSEIAATRVRLDDRELDLIDRARHDGATWADIARALGLGSRQAAEQRRQRLAAARRARVTRLDPAGAPDLPVLRTAVDDLRRWIETDRAWDGRFPRAALTRRTCALALDAPAGPLYALAAHLADDLAGAGLRLPPPVRDAAGRITATLSTRN